MTSYFVDSSALVKRYVPERGTVWIRSITSRSTGHTIVVAQITQVEVFSGICRRKRENLVPVRAVQTIRLLLTRHTRREYLVVGLSESIIQRAEDLLENPPLRAYDSIQLASALTANASLTAAGLPALTFVSADIQLLSAATAEGLPVDDPNNHP